MGVEDWHWRLAGDPQNVPWDCAACSLAWCLRTIGFDLSESEVIEGLGPGRISPTYGLLDASGAGLVGYVSELGISAESNPNADWTDVCAAAGFQPMLIGGRRWYHWAGVRMGPIAANRPDLDVLALMNPAEGYMGVAQTITRGQFGELGPFSAVWFTGW
jgi:hypothetical protein